MDLGIIVAISENNVIGKDGTLPWHLPEDLKHFRELTLGSPIIMGRKTYESIGKALPDRMNIVLSRNNFRGENIEVFNSLNYALGALEESGHNKAYVIGGSGIYENAMPLSNFLEITRIHRDVEGDTYFPVIDWRDWKETARDDKDDFSFVSYIRKG